VATTPATQQTSRRRGNAGGDSDGSDDSQDGSEPPDPQGYVAHVALERNTMVTEAGRMALGPGMKVTTEIKAGNRTVMSYLLSRGLRCHQESMRER
jgi:hemolysin D